VAVGQLDSRRAAAPAPTLARPVAAAGDRRPVKRSRWRSTPGRMTGNLVVLFVLALAFGIAGTVGGIQRGNQVGSVRTGSGPLTVQAQSLYRALSDADSTEASAFLAAGAEPPVLRSRYLGDIATASAALTALSASGSDTPALRSLSVGLPIYTGLVETARADNRLGLPVGAAYLREASGQMRTVLLRAAKTLYDDERAQLASDRNDGGGFPWIAIPLGAIVLILLIRAQQAMTRRTKRILNPGLVAATLTVVIAIGWITVSWAVDADHLHSSRADGSDRVNVLVNARIDALRARADEALTLVARGNDASFDADFKAMMTDLTGDRGLLQQAASAPVAPGLRADVEAAATDLKAWQAENTAMRATNDKGDYPGAVASVIGPDATDAPTLFARVDNDLDRGIEAANKEFAVQAKDAATALGGLAIGVGALIIVALAGLTVGFQRRIAEYR
jgi:hypothetical protein